MTDKAISTPVQSSVVTPQPVTQETLPPLSAPAQTAVALSESTGACALPEGAQQQLPADILAQAITLQKPQAGLIERHDYSGDRTYNFAFNMKDAVVSQDGQNIIIKFADGAEIILEAFMDKATATSTFIYDSCEQVTVDSFLGSVDMAAALNAIAPAAGAAAAGPQAATAAQNDGAGFSPFDPGALPGTPQAVGPLGPTSLSYGLIDGDRRTEIFGRDLGAPDDTPGGINVPNPLSTLDETGGGGSGGSFDNPRTSTGTIQVDYGNDGKGSIRIIEGPAGTSHRGETITIEISTDGLTATGKTPDGKVVYEFTLDPDTSTYTFTLDRSLDHPDATNPNDPLDLPFVIRVTDRDGDFTDGTAVVRVLDDGPAGGDVAQATVDEDTGSTLVAGGTLNFSYGGDGAGSVKLTGGPAGLTSGGQPVGVTVTDGVVTGTRTDGTTVFTLTLNPATGAWTYKQTAPLDHPDSSNANDGLPLTFDVKVTDYDGDTATTTITVNVLDGGPKIGQPVATVDETGGFDTVTGNLTYSYGPDGAGDIKLTTLPTGLTSHGQAVTVVLSADGHTATATRTDGTVVFTLTLNTTNGTYTFSQKAPLDHANPNNHNDALDLGFGIVVSDRDGDTANGSLKVTVLDDGPTASSFTITAGEVGSGAVTGTLPAGYGLDGAGSISFPGTLTGLTSAGAAIAVTASGNVLTGKLADGSVVFTLTLANGSYSYVQSKPIDGNPELNIPYQVKDADGDTAIAAICITLKDGTPTAGTATGGINSATVDETGGFDTVTGNLTYSYGPDGAGDIKLTTLPTGLTSHGQAVTVVLSADGHTATATRTDGTVVFTLTLNTTNGTYTFSQKAPLDHANPNNHNDALDLGFGIVVSDRDGDTANGSLKVTVLDDGPTASSFTITAGEVGSGAVTGTLPAGYGLDGAGSISFPGTLTGLTSAGAAIAVTASGNVLTGKLADGSVVFTLTLANGSYSYVQSKPIDGNPELNIPYQVKDADGDTAIAAICITLKDGTPTAGTATGGINSATVDETGGFDTVTGNLTYSYGPDGAGDIKLTTLPTGLTSQGQAVTVVLSADGHTATATRTDGTVVFTLSLNTSNGTYTFSQKAPLDHANPNNHNDALDLGFGIVVSDRDGDTANGSLKVTVLDDGPTASSFTITAGEVGSGAVTGTLPAGYGLDGAGAISFPGTLTGLTSAGAAIAVTAAGNVLTGKLADGSVVFTLTLANGSYSYVQSKPIDGNPELNIPYQVKDADGDTAIAAICITLKDGTPTAGTATGGINSATVDETGGFDTVTGNLTYSYGPDGAGDIKLTTLPTGLTSQGQAVTVVLSTDGHTATATRTDGTVVFTLSLNTTNGTYTFSQKAPLDHANPNNHNDALDLGFGIVVSDRDGDTANGSLKVTVLDDGPTASSFTITAGEVGSGAVTGTLPAGYGLDGAGAISFPGTLTGLTSAGAAVTVTAAGNVLTGKLADGSVVFTLTLANGSYSYVQNKPIDGNPALNIPYQVKDADGDTAIAAICITLKDGTPTAGTATGGINSATVDETGGFDTVTGNLTYSYGPDGAGDIKLTTLPTGLTSHGQAVTVVLSADGHTATATRTDGTVVFTLTLNTANGTYTFSQKAPLDHANPNNHNDALDLGFGIVVSDRDGDTANGSLKVTVLDDGPSASSFTITAGEVGSGAVTGTLPAGYGLDGAGAISFPGTLTGLTSAGAAIAVTAAGNVLTGKLADGSVVFTLTLANGSYSYVQSKPIDGNPALSIPYSIKDADGDVANATISITLKDGTPTAGTATGGINSATVDETGGFDTVTGNLTYSYGPDGAGDIKLTTLPTGLTSHGQAVTVVLSADGHTATATRTDGTVVFTLTLNTANGTYTFSQKAPLDHANPNNHNDALDLGFGIVVSDRDGDTANGSLKVTVLDDGPSASSFTITAGEVGSGAVTGTLPAGYGLDGAGAISFPGTLTGLTSAGAAIAVTAAGNVLTGKLADGSVVFTLTLANGSYSYVQSKPIDGNPALSIPYSIKDADGDVANATISITLKDGTPTAGTATGGINSATVDETGGFDTVTGNLTYSYGPDGAGDIKLTTLPTGLTSHGQAVTVVLSADGHTATATRTDGTVVFTLTLNTTNGTYTFSQKAPLDHANPNNHNDALDLGFGIVVSDRDGDTANGSLKVTVLDDGPTASSFTITAGEVGSGAVTGTLPAGYGLDGAGAISFPGTLTGLTSAGAAVTVTAAGNVLTGKLADGSVVFTLTLANGSYSYVQSKPIDGNPALSIPYSIKDADGDVANATISITLKDGTPTAGTATGGINTATVDETGGFDTVTGNLTYSYGPDGAGDIKLTTLPTGLTSHGQAVTVVLSADGHTATATRTDGTVVFTLSLNTTNGTYTFSQKAPLDHANPNNHNDALDLGFGIVVSDRDGDTANGSLKVTVLDDGPSASVVMSTLDESSAVDTVGSAIDGIWATATAGTPISVSGTASFGYGMDGAGSVALVAGPSGLTHHGAAILTTTSGNVVTGKLADGTLVFTLSMNAVTGAYEYKQFASIDHPNTADHNDPTTLNFSLKVTDGDGDSATGAVQIKLLDDGPRADVTEMAIDQTVQDDANPNTPIIVATGKLDADFGSDGAGKITLTGGIGGQTLYSCGLPITVSLVSGVLTGKLTSGQTIFTLSVDGNTGAYTFKQYGQIDAGDRGINIPIDFKVTDGDGDTTTSTLGLKITGEVLSLEPPFVVLSAAYEISQVTVITPEGTTSERVVKLDIGVAIVDQDSDTLSAATMHLQAGSGEKLLLGQSYSVADNGHIIYNDVDTGITFTQLSDGGFSLSGEAALSTYQQILDHVALDGNGQSSSRTITVQVTDETGLVSNLGAVTLQNTVISPLDDSYDPVVVTGPNGTEISSSSSVVVTASSSTSSSMALALSDVVESDDTGAVVATDGGEAILAGAPQQVAEANSTVVATTTDSTATSAISDGSEDLSRFQNG
jgi:T1SS-143 domain-containing protein